jgi:hypothetical protein
LGSRKAQKDAEVLALDGLAFLAGSSGELARFVESSGIALDELRARATEPAVLAAVLGYLLSDDQRLLAFCSEQSIDPKDVHLAQYALERGRKFVRPS